MLHNMLFHRESCRNEEPWEWRAYHHRFVFLYFQICLFGFLAVVGRGGHNVVEWFAGFEYKRVGVAVFAQSVHLGAGVEYLLELVYHDRLSI